MRGREDAREFLFIALLFEESKELGFGSARIGDIGVGGTRFWVLSSPLNSEFRKNISTEVSLCGERERTRENGYSCSRIRKIAILRLVCIESGVERSEIRDAGRISCRSGVV